MASRVTDVFLDTDTSEATYRLARDANCLAGLSSDAVDEVLTNVASELPATGSLFESAIDGQRLRVTAPVGLEYAV